MTISAGWRGMEPKLLNNLTIEVAGNDFASLKCFAPYIPLSYFLSLLQFFFLSVGLIQEGNQYEIE
jgi:hypothetical protein